MDVDKLIGNIPELLLYFIPGYISIRIKEIYGFQKKHDEFSSKLYCILYSFIILLMYNIIVKVFTSLWPITKNFLNDDTIKRIICLLLATTLGIILVKLPKSKIGRFYAKKINRHTSPEETVWEKAMKAGKGTWATVYLKNGMVYIGKLINFTSDPDEPSKAILLYNYSLAIRKCEEIDSSKDFYLPIKEKSSDNNCRVYLQLDDIISIEIDPPN